MTDATVLTLPSLVIVTGTVTAAMLTKIELGALVRVSGTLISLAVDVVLVAVGVVDESVD